MAVPSLIDLCVQAAVSSRHWTVQRRSLERLPDHAANELLALLLARQSPRLPSGPGASGSSSGSGGSSGGGGGGGGHSERGGGLVCGGAGGPPLRPATLELFRHCVTRVALTGPAVTPEWLAALAGFGHLDTLRLSGCTRLNTAALLALLASTPPPSPPPPATSPSPSASTSSPSTSSTSTSASWRSPGPGPGSSRSASGSSRPRVGPGPVPSPPPLPPLPPLVSSPASASLRHLELRGCSRLGDDSLACLARMRQLQSLDISETGVEGPGLSALTGLTGLTRLQAGGLKSVGDTAWVGLLSCLPGLRHLDLWGSDAGGGPDGGEALLLLLAAGLTELSHLGAAWTPLGTLPALPGLQVLDMRHCQLREVWWPAGQPSRLALKQLLLRGATLTGPVAAAAAAASSSGSESPAGLGSVIRHSAATLEHLDLCEVSSTDPWVAPLAALAAADGAAASRLTRLDISRTAVQPEDLEYLQAVPRLQALAAAGTRAGSPRGAAALVAAGLSQLQDLDLSGCSVTDAAMSWLQQLTALTALNLAANPELTLAPPPQPPQQQQQHLPQLPPLQPQLQPENPAALPDVWAAAAENAAAAGAAPPAVGAAVPAPLGRSSRASDVPPGILSSGGSVDGGRAGRGVATSEHRGCADADGETDDGGAAGVWPQLRRLNVLGTRVGEAGMRALLNAAAGGSGGESRDRPAGRRASSGGGGGPLQRLEQLKVGGPGFTDGAAAALAAAALPSLHSLLVRDGPLSGHGALKLAAGLAAGGCLRRLELQGCWLISEQDAARLAAACRRQGALVVVNGKAASAAGTVMGVAAAAESRGGAGAAVTSQQERGAAGGGRQAGGGRGAAGAAEDLSCFDQRLRYDKDALLRLAASPLVGGGDDATGGAGSGGGGFVAGELWATLPADLRR